VIALSDEPADLANEAFYRAMHVVLARYCYRKSSVRPSMTLMYAGDPQNIWNLRIFRGRYIVETLTNNANII